MINVTYMIFILNFIFIIVFYAVIWLKKDRICIIDKNF
jgi:hypothetical protein